MNKLWYVIFGLTVVIVLLLLFQPTNESQKVKDLEAKVKSREDAIFQLHRESLALKDKVKVDSVKQAQERDTFQNAIGSLQARLKVKRVEIDTLILESPALADYVATADSVIQMQSARIDTLEANLKELRVDLAGITFNFQERLDLQSESLADLTAITTDQRKQIRKLRRATRLLKVATVVGFIGGVFLGSQ